MAKQRLDLACVERGLCESREQARRLILAGKVRRNGAVCDKASAGVVAEDEIVVEAPPRYVGRGGLKLEGALDAFGVDPTGRVCLDIGSSTGGFTDCLLQRGAVRVHAVDVGTNQLVWKLRQDPRVVVRERCNARYLKEEDLGEKVSLAVCDVSFISLTKILPVAAALLEGGGEGLVLIKPQFELERGEVGKGGVVREEGLRRKAVAKVRDFVEDEGLFDWRGVAAAAVAGADGNQEYVAWLGKPGAGG